MYTSSVMLLEHKLTYTDFFNAIEWAVRETYPDTIPVVGMGSGADSGTIAAALWSLGKQFKVCSLEGSENLDVLYKRLDILDKDAIIVPPLNDHQITNTFTDMEDAGFVQGEGTGIGAALSHFVLGSKVPGSYLYSGLGTDEFYTEDLEKLVVFMWRSHQAYNHFNIKTIFPLLKPIVFTEYYCLHPDLRLYYKQPFLEYCKSKDFPIDDSKKNFYCY